MDLQNLSGGKPLTKATINESVEKLKALFLDGTVSPLKTAIELKAMERAIEIVTKDNEVKEAVLDEARKYNDRDMQIQGAKFRVGTSAPSWDFTGSEQWVETVAEIKRLTVLKKGIEAVMKAVYKSNMEVADTTTGDVVKLKLKKGGTEFLAVTFE